jgi:hypothetical protein
VKPRLTGSVALALLALLVSCGDGQRPESPATGGRTLADIARELAAGELEVAVWQTCALSSIGAVGVRLTGPGLEFEIYQLNGRRLRTAIVAARAVASEQRRRGETPIRHFTRGPCFVLVRREPRAGAVRQAVRSVIPAGNGPALPTPRRRDS